ncbi:MAG TPA: TonB-dependent receptor [Gemmatimonadaceae bacterium]|nr:TonB-dependent receptor [Gemmatimonadaceae bacterium]
MRRPSIVLGLLLLAALPLAAQDAPVLRGTVRDSLGRPLSRVEVSYRNVRTVSDTGGRFELSPVPLGRISVRFARDGVLIGEVEAKVTNDTTPDVSVEVVGDRSEPRTLRGTVVDENRQPLRDVVVDVLTGLQETRTDSAGQFVIRELPARRHLVRVRRVGSTPTYLFADLSDEASTRVRVVLRQFAGQNLGLVVVRATRGPSHLQGFLRRATRPSGWGRLYTEQQIAARNPLRPSDMLQTVPGLRVNNAGLGRTVLTGRGGCRLTLFINGMQIPQRGGFGIDELVSVQDLAGLEVYNGIGGVPPELMMGGADNSCGTVGIWTK